LLAIRKIHEQYGHIQEIIVQNFRAKPNTKMAQAPEPDLEDLIWTLAVARLIFGPTMSMQAPPNLSPGVLPQLVAGGINDWGGVSPLTPDHVNPEAPWPHLDKLAHETATAGKFLEQRLTIYPSYVMDAEKWLDPGIMPAVLSHSDSMGFAKRDNWLPGASQEIPALEIGLSEHRQPASPTVQSIIEKARACEILSEKDIEKLFEARGPDFSAVVHAADEIRKETVGDVVSYVVNRNINYTNVCYFRCQFCAFSKGKMAENLRGKPYDISADEIARRCIEAWERGATEVCMQGGIHPDYTGQTYIDIVRTVKQAVPDMHVHAFSPLEVWQGAETLGISLTEFLQKLKAAGLNTLPGTAAEVLHDEVRQKICADKLNTAQWLEVIAAAHEVGFNTTATIMFGHVDRPRHWASHLHAIRDLHEHSRGFTEFVPLPYVASEAPMYLKGKSRRGPSARESLLMHAVPRLVFNGAIHNIQTSWVKMGQRGAMLALNCGANDLGGSLMNESITRAAGAEHGQEWVPRQITAAVTAAGRLPRMRTTLYADAPEQQRIRAFEAADLTQIINTDAGKHQRSKALQDARTEAQRSIQG
jgi:FO synthase